jgi:hypothetical protein
VEKEKDETGEKEAAATKEETQIVFAAVTH